MRREICDTPIERFEYPIRSTLKEYTDWSDGELEFDFDSAANLEYDYETDLFRSRSLVRHLGKTTINRFTTDLEIIAIPPGRDLSSARQIDRLSDIDTEVHLAIASKRLGLDNPVIKFAGHLAVICSFDGKFKEVGHLGQNDTFFDYIMDGGVQAVPTATVAIGYADNPRRPSNRGDRFGDYCKISNKTSDIIQVCGFVSVSPEEIDNGIGLIKAFDPRS